MKKVLELVISSILLFSFFGCQHPDEYIVAADKAFELAPLADKNVETVCLNLYNQVSEHTKELVDSGQMSQEDRQKVLDLLKDQVVETRKQTLFLFEFTKLAYQDAHSSTLKSSDFIDLLKNTNDVIPEVKKFIDLLK